MNDVSFSSSEVALIGALLASLTGALSVVFYMLRASYQDRIADARGYLVETQRQNNELRPALERLTEAVNRQSALIERLIERRERAR